MNEMLVNARCGSVRGEAWGEGGIFRGIPYGRAHRFLPPEPVTWDGERQCLRFGPPAPQPNYRGVKKPGFIYAMIGSEDCLTVNVWTSSLTPAKPLPVVIDVYGGAFQVGRTDIEAMDGALFMEGEDMVYVSVNYRVGALGFLELGDRFGGKYAGSGSNGLRDLALAVRWVTENIAAFGGDAERITLMGISAGAKSIGALLTLPEIQARVHSVVMESGAMQAFRTPESAERVTERFLALFAKEEDILSLPAADIVERQAEFCSVEGCTCFFGPVLSSPFAPDWMERWDAGERFTGRALLGSGRHELIHLTSAPGFEQRAEQVAQDMFGRYNGGLAIQKHRELVEAGTDSAAAWEPVFSDFMYRFYTNALAKKLREDGSRVWVYSFDYAPGYHGQGFSFLKRDNALFHGQGTQQQQADAERISRLFRSQVRRFILEGEPDPAVWKEWNSGEKLSLDTCPRMEYRPDDTLTGFPPRAFAEEE